MPKRLLVALMQSLNTLENTHIKWLSVITGYAVLNDEEGSVTFDYKDYADEGSQKQMTLATSEFIRRFEQHILPERFTKIRTYGYVANRNRRQRINEVLKKMKLLLHKGRIKIPFQIRMLEQFGIDMNECPACKNKTLKQVKAVPAISKI